MSSGGKGGSASKSTNYYGTVAGALCWGPLDWLSAVILNGNYIFQGSLALTADVTDLTGSLADPTLIASGGYLKIYRGTETQTADAALAGHPPMKGTAYLVGKNLFFGQDSGTAPNLQIIGGRLPRVATSIVAGADNIADDGQVNPIACLAEILLDERGGALAQAQLDAASWLAAAHWCAQDQAHRDFTFCSPLFTEQAALRDIVKQLLEPFNGFCRWTNSGTLACHIYEWGVDPGGLTTLDARHWTKRPQIPTGDWTDVPTELLATFTDRDYEYQENSHLVPNARVAQIRQLDDQHRIERKHVTRQSQVHQHAVEYQRRIGTAPAMATMKVRSPFVAGLNVGDKIKLDTDPEPGGAGLAQLVQVQTIAQDRSDEATLKVMTDNLVPATAYTPAWTPATPTDPVSPPLDYFLAVPLPPAAWGLPRAVGLLATRSAPNQIGFEVFFGATHAGSFAELGAQAGFAVRAQLQAGISDSVTTVPLTELDGLTGPEAGLAANTPGGNTTAADNNTLLAILALLDGDGRISLGADGTPDIEIMSIVDRAVVSGATFNYTVQRARLNTVARAWSTGAVAWIVPRINLEPWRCAGLDEITGAVAFFRLVSFTSAALDDSTPVPECGVNMLPATTLLSPPSVSPGSQLFTGTLTVTIEAVSGVTVRYTTDNSPVGPASPVFPGGGLSVTQTTTLRLRAYDDASPSASAEAIYFYTLDGATSTVATPVFIKNSGSWGRNTVNLTLACATAGATIHYKINGGSDTTYAGAFNLTLNSYLEAWAVKASWNDSAVLFVANYYEPPEGGGVLP